MDKNSIAELMMSWRKPLQFIDVKEFVKNHTHIRYCEAIIRQDGMVAYVSPSHVESLIEITGEDREVIDKKMPVWESPIQWLVEYTGCVSVWYDYMIMPSNVTAEQTKSIEVLVENKIICINKT